MKSFVPAGQVDYSVLVFIPDPASTDGSGKTGLVAANLTVSYSRVETDNDVTVTDATSSLNDLAALTTAHTDWGLKEVSNTLAPGLYRLDLADAVFASGAWSAVVYVMITTSAAAASPMEFSIGPVEANMTQVRGGSEAAIWLDAQAWQGLAQTGTLSTTQATTDLIGVGDDIFTGKWGIIWKDSGQIGIVTGYVSATGLFTWAPAIQNAPVNNDIFILFPAATALAVGDRTGALSTLAAALNTALDTHDGPDLPGGSVATDGGNSATSFKTTLTESADDYWKDALLLITSGALVGQVKKVSAYDGTTKIITVVGGFTGIPADAVTFLLINR